ncbi:riboflavin-binding protein-like isoform X2 [Rhinoraja longicauda]
MFNRSAKMLWIAVVLLCGTVEQLDANCQAAWGHKASPSPEPDLIDCPLYSKNACCSADTDDKTSSLPDVEPWNRCGILSTKCEQFYKQLSCFYRCSPDTKIWASSGLPNRLVNVPLCHSFCDQWYKACKNDLTCTKNWNSGLKPSNSTQTNCTSECIPHSKMYKNGKDLCESSAGDTFTVRSCSCLSLDKGDGRVVAALRRNDSTKAGANGKLPCRDKRSVINKLSRSVHKRSLFVEDIDGSGSGFATTE